MLDALPQFFYKKISCWANQRVFQGQMIDLVNLLAVRMGKVATGLGSDIIDGTEIVLT